MGEKLHRENVILEHLHGFTHLAISLTWSAFLPALKKIAVSLIEKSDETPGLHLWLIL